MTASPIAESTRGDELVVLDGTTFFVSDRKGDAGAADSHGYFFDDVRHLSQWQLFVRGHELLPVTSSSVDAYSARILLAPSPENPPFSIRRDRFVGEAVHEDIVVTNLVDAVQKLTIELQLAADFADVMDAQGGQSSFDGGERAIRRAPGAVTFTCDCDGFHRETIIDFGTDCTVHDDRAVFEIELAPHGSWRTCVEIVAISQSRRARPLLRCGAFHAPQADMPLSMEDFVSQAPVLEARDVDLRRTYRQCLHDLAALRIRPRPELEHAMPAGGMPWFMTVFGRDSLLASFEALPFQPTLAEATLHALAEMQASVRDDWRDSEPGKIPHELRRGKLVALGKSPRDPYYGTHDATQLWLILLDEYERWTGDTETILKLEPNARRALAWIDGDGDPDGDGYLEYESRSSKGLRNLGWKDSDDAIVDRSGRVVDPPIATCEIQGYTYDARLRAARLARDFWSDPELAARQEHEASQLKERFNRDYWDDEHETFVLALAGRRSKHRVDSVTSNPGQLLWSGIVDDELAPRLVERLLRPDMFSGWGIRTLSEDERAYSPLAYHRGTVWPHDTALIAAGMRRYGFDEEAGRLIRALFDVAVSFAHRLPEVFAGFARDETNLPIRYPAALVPQAWAAGAPLLALRTILGLECSDGRLRSDPLAGFDDVRLRRLRVRGRHHDVP